MQGRWLASLCVLLAGVLPANAAAQLLPEPARVAVDFDRTHVIRVTAAGDAGTIDRKVTADDPVRVASISKLFVAIAVMRLVDEGKLDLDRDIDSYLGFSIRNPEFPDKPISMRLLLSHRAGITDGIDYLLPLDGDIGAAMQDRKAWLPGKAPGEWYHYSNLNFPVVAAVMEAATGERFDRIVASRVLTPLKLDACFNWQSGCSPDRWRKAVTLLRTNGDLARDPQTGEKCPVAPARDGGCDLAAYQLGRNGSSFSPQGGLRISALDLARAGQFLLRKGKPILSARAFAEMARPHWNAEQQPADGEVISGGYGLGLQVATDDKGETWIGHSGSAYALRSGLWVNPKTGKGRVRFVTMVAENAPDGNCRVTCP